MRQINPIVRNAVLNVLHAFDNMIRDDRAMAYVNFQARLLPDYWEDPELTKGYVELFEQPTQHVSCKRCGRNVVFDGEPRPTTAGTTHSAEAGKPNRRIDKANDGAPRGRSSGAQTQDAALRQVV
jgi:hypothetical protein